MTIQGISERINCTYQIIKYRILFGRRIRIGQDVLIRKRLSVTMTENARLEIGHDTFFNNDCSINARSRIFIGSDCLFGENVRIYDHNHIYKDAKTPIRDQGFKLKPVHIGNNCWIGSNVVILAGAEIGNHCVIGANCIIRGKIEDNMMVVNEQKLIVKPIEG